MLSLLKLAMIILVVAFGLWIYENEFDNEPIIRGLDAILGYLGGLLLAFAFIGGTVFHITGKTVKWKMKTRCIRCGVKINKNEMYCPKHKQEVAEEFLRGTDPHAFFE
jgi:hypothetical protein